MEERFLKITGVRIVPGATLVDYWDYDMTVVTTESGAFIAHGWTAPTWGAMIGTTVPVTTECCKADSLLQWIKWRD